VITNLLLAVANYMPRYLYWQRHYAVKSSTTATSTPCAFTGILYPARYGCRHPSMTGRWSG